MFNRKKLKRARQERDYLLRWLGGFNAELTGLSADTLTRIALGVEHPNGPNVSLPMDSGDLKRCERAFAQMPGHMQERCLPIFKDWQDKILAITKERGW